MRVPIERIIRAVNEDRVVGITVSLGSDLAVVKIDAVVPSDEIRDILEGDVIDGECYVVKDMLSLPPAPTQEGDS